MKTVFRNEQFLVFEFVKHSRSIPNSKVDEESINFHHEQPKIDPKLPAHAVAKQITSITCIAVDITSEAIFSTKILS